MPISPLRFLLGVLILSFVGTSAAEPAQKLSVIVPTRKPVLAEGGPPIISNLSSGLRAIIDGEAILKGTDEVGRLVVSTPVTAQTAFHASQAIQSFIDITPPAWRKVDGLKISYDAQSPPTAGDLEGARLRLVEDYRRGPFILVEPISKQIDAPLARRLAENKRFRYSTLAMSIQAASPTNLVAVGQAPAPVFLPIPNAPNDTLFSDLWGMRNIHALQAWSKVHDSSVVVAVIDSGVDYTHPDLQSNMWKDGQGKYGYNFVDNNSDPMDQFGHGTHCAGTIGAVGNNQLGVVGVNWKAQIMAVRWMDASGNGKLANAIKAIDYAVDHGAKVLNISWFWPENDPSLLAALKRARERGVLVVACASNYAMNLDNSGGDNDDPTTFGRYPSSYPLDNIISVAAIDPSDHLANFSNSGKATVHLAAPGVLVKSTVPNSQYDGSYSGTSMATPHVAGAAALIWSQDLGASPGDIKNRLLNGARKVPDLQDKCVSGGTLDLSFVAPSVP